jgi:putative FmdB family regulatory protein
VYRCDQCGSVIERRQSFSDAPLTECEACQGRLQRVLQPVGIIFKGSGFYSTDNRAGSASAKNGDGEKTDSSAAADSKSAESKPASESGSSSESSKDSTAKPTASKASAAKDSSPSGSSSQS